MTARVCPVHGEYAADGICRWCEPPKPTPTNLPAGSTPCRCGEYAWLPGAVGERNGVIAGVAHSPEQCFKLDAEPPAPDAYGESPGAQALRDVKALVDAAPTYFGMKVVIDPSLRNEEWYLRWDVPAKPADANSPRYPLLNYLPPEYDHTEAVITAETHAAEESRLLLQHAALRWERVARRWANKHGPWTLRDFAQHWQFFLNKLIALSFEHLARTNPMLSDNPKEPKP